MGQKSRSLHTSGSCALHHASRWLLFSKTSPAHIRNPNVAVETASKLIEFLFSRS